MSAPRVLPAFLLALCAALPAAAQDDPPAPDADIVVTAPVDLDALPVQADRMAEGGRTSRALGSEAARFVRCTGLPKPRDLRLILDHSPGDSLATHALHNFIVRNPGCYGTLQSPQPESPFFGACNPHFVTSASYDTICRTTFDRGALYEQAVKTWGEGIALTRAQTFDRAVRARFLRRQQDFDKQRVALDRTYAGAVGCLVQVSPQIGRELLAAAPGSAEEERARRLLIGYGGPCLGDPLTVTADPAQFRAYTAEAVYAWLVAAANRTTLVG